MRRPLLESDRRRGGPVQCSPPRKPLRLLARSCNVGCVHSAVEGEKPPTPRHSIGDGSANGLDPTTPLKISSRYRLDSQKVVSELGKTPPLGFRPKQSRTTSLRVLFGDEAATVALSKLKPFGVEIALDDFGRLLIASISPVGLSHYHLKRSDPKIARGSVGSHENPADSEFNVRDPFPAQRGWCRISPHLRTKLVRPAQSVKSS